LPPEGELGVCVFCVEVGSDGGVQLPVDVVDEGVDVVVASGVAGEVGVVDGADCVDGVVDGVVLVVSVDVLVVPPDVLVVPV
jgi:hypothetical protein